MATTWLDDTHIMNIESESPVKLPWDFRQYDPHNSWYQTASIKLNDKP